MKRTNSPLTRHLIQDGLRGVQTPQKPQKPQDPFTFRVMGPAGFLADQGIQEGVTTVTILRRGHVVSVSIHQKD